MDQILNYLAGVLGVDQPTFLLILGVIIAVSNLIGKLIPDDQTGALGVVRKVAKVLGLYVSSRVTKGVSVTDTAKVVADRYKIQSPWYIGIVAILFTLFFLSACTAAQKERVNSTLGTICTSTPLAQALYNGALASHDNARVNEILNYLQAACPAVLVIVQTIPTRQQPEVIVLPPPVQPAIGPERGR